MRTPSISTTPSEFTSIGGLVFALHRLDSGVMAVAASSPTAAAAGQGFAHAFDRLVQMSMLRYVGEGRLSECVAVSDETREVDRFSRRIGFARAARAELRSGRISEETRVFLDAYCDGVNSYLAKFRRPAEFIALRVHPEPWKAEDVLATLKIMSFIGLAQSQGEMEKLIVETAAATTAKSDGGGDGDELDVLTRLRALCAPHLDGMSDEVVATLRQVRMADRLVPDAVRFLQCLPTVLASNNWVVSGRVAAGDTSLAACDPHLEVNRLPAIWYEVLVTVGETYQVGITCPGAPGVIMGRNADITWSFTYGFMDQVDFFLEEVRDGMVRRGDGWGPLTRTAEIMDFKDGAKPERVVIWSSDVGDLETTHADSLSTVPDPEAKYGTHKRQLPDGFYLARAWTGTIPGTAIRSVEALRALQLAKSVDEALPLVAQVAISCNWLLAERASDRIAYQQSGAMPRRAAGHSGLHPVPAWDTANHWQGLVDPSELYTVDDPPEGVLVTANQDLGDDTSPLAINLPMGPYRANRIRALLDEAVARGGVTMDDMAAIQGDLHSTQADVFLPLWQPYLESAAADGNKAAATLLTWDRRYNVESRGAPVFEHIYEALLKTVFAVLFPPQVLDHLFNETGIITDFYLVFDKILLGGDNVDDVLWFGPLGGRAAAVRHAVTTGLTAAGNATAAWGESRRVTMINILLGGKVPAFLGFDHTITLPGNRATIVQGAIYRSGGRTSSFAPSFRLLTNLADDVVLTQLAGGVSGSRFSSLYKQGVSQWERNEYKPIDCAGVQMASAHATKDGEEEEDGNAKKRARWS